MHSCCSERRMWVWSLCLIFFSLSYTILVVAAFSSSSPVKHLCLQDQKDALWEFKNEFYLRRFYTDPMFTYTKTEEWKKDIDCCYWDGVSCDHKTGKVVELDVQGSSLNGPLRSNSSLFRLQHLQSLRLGSNNIWGILPDSIGNFKYLKVLYIGDCNFFGKLLQLQMKDLSRSRLGEEVITHPMTYIEGYGHFLHNEKTMTKSLEEEMEELLANDPEAAKSLLESKGLYLMPLSSVDY